MNILTPAYLHLMIASLTPFFGGSINEINPKNTYSLSGKFFSFAEYSSS